MEERSLFDPRGPLFDRPATPNQQEQPRQPTGAELRDVAMGGVQYKRGRWIELAVVSFRRMAERYDQFTTDEVWEDLDRVGVAYPEGGGRAMGCAVKAAKARGIIARKPVGERCSRRPLCHARPIKVYRSLALTDLGLHGRPPLGGARSSG